MKDNIHTPTIEEIRLFHEGSLPEWRAVEIRNQAANDPLLADALEGFAEIPAYSAVPHFSIGSATIASSASSVWWHLNGWLAGLIVGTATAVAVIQPESSNGDTAFVANVSEGEKEVRTEQIVTDNEAIAYTDQKKEEQNVSSNAVSNSEQPLITSNEKPLEPVIPLQQATKISDLLIGDEKINISELSSSRMVAVKIVHVMDYRLADYTQLRKSDWSVELGGVDASKEHQDDEHETMVQHEMIPYLDYMEVCIRAFDEDRYADAIESMKTLLYQYPQDINAIFYTGMSYFYSGSYEKAIEFFDRALINEMGAFREEALFYKGRSLKAQGKDEEARRIFQSVVDQNRFYKQAAEKELSE